MKLRIADSLTEEERRRLFGWGEDIFGVSNLNLQWRPKDVHLLIEVEGRPVCHVGLLRHTVTVNRHPVEVGGIGSVVTVPEMQGKGYARHALTSAASLMCQDWGVKFGLLFCREPLVPFYGALGWRRVRETVEVEQSSGQIVFPLAMMVLPCAGRDWPDGPVDIVSLPW